MLLNIVFIVVGIALVIWGADRLTDGAASLARGMNVPEIIIGLTIVAAGTSAPELFVSMVSALKGTADLAVGNVIGSNIFNTMLIVGCSAVVAPMTVAKSTVKKDIPFAVIASILLFMLCFDDMDSPHLWGNEISRSDGFILLAGFLIFMVYTFNAAKKEGLMPTEEEREDLKEMPQMDGEVSSIYPKVGELVGTGSPIMTISIMNDMWGTFNVREDQLNGLAIDSTFTAFVPAFNKDIQMKVYYMKDQGSFAVWKATKATGEYDLKTFEVKARPVEKLEGLRPGMTLIIKQ